MLLLFSYWLFLIFKQPKSYLSWISNINAMVFVFCILFNIFRGEQSLHLTVLIFSLLSALLIHIKLKNLPKISWYLKKTEKHSAILSAVFISWVFSKMNAIQMVPIYFISFLLLALICYINRKNKVQ